jgi:hypothetical protein
VAFMVGIAAMIVVHTAVSVMLTLSQIIEDADIVVCTTFMATCKTMLNCAVPFDLVGNDEYPANRDDQAIGPVLFQERVKIYVGVGDPNQSFGFVVSPRTSQLKISIHRRLVRPEQPFHGLVQFQVQHRMEKNLVDFVNRSVILFYVPFKMLTGTQSRLRRPVGHRHFRSGW